MKFDGDYICSYDTVDGSLDVDQLISWEDITYAFAGTNGDSA